MYYARTFYIGIFGKYAVTKKSPILKKWSIHVHKPVSLQMMLSSKRLFIVITDKGFSLVCIKLEHFTSAFLQIFRHKQITYLKKRSSQVQHQRVSLQMLLSSKRFPAGKRFLSSMY